MFNLSVTELALIVILAISTLGARETVRCLRTVQKFFAHIGLTYNRYIGYLMEELDYNEQQHQHHTKDKNDTKTSGHNNI